ncbi:hypothetical protein EPI10_002902 [Gossypium australe]|uniref:Uncharacterized protein n=1 Tax=Gossypium australe TaxID=47621 RepID=A0A5B6VFL3_9ROSI|nr:hypothetical protein EPI10_002902 [Gossypium australe]
MGFASFVGRIWVFTIVALFLANDGLLLVFFKFRRYNLPDRTVFCLDCYKLPDRTVLVQSNS